MEERKTLFHTYVSYEKLPERRYLRSWVRTAIFFTLNATTTAAFVVLGIKLIGLD